MIEINLLPGAKKKRGGKGAGFQMPDFKAMAGAIKDPWLVACVSTWVLVVAGVMLFWVPRHNEVKALEPDLQRAQDEALVLARVRGTKTRTEKQRDSLLREIAIIKNIDRERYIWPHILDAITKALPPYTWLDEITSQAGAEDSATGAVSVSVQITGKSADIQAVTRFVRNLEESAFLETATQVSTAVSHEGNRDLFTYVIKAQYQQPDSTLLTLQPLAASLVQGYRSGATRPGR